MVVKHSPGNAENFFDERLDTDACKSLTFNSFIGYLIVLVEK